MSAGTLYQMWASTGKAAAIFSASLYARISGYARLLQRRLIYVGHLAYWTVRHRSIDTARWVVEFEGLSW